MSISIEAIVAILALFVALPPAILTVKHWFLRRRLQRDTREITLAPSFNVPKLTTRVQTDQLEPTAFLASSPQPSSPRYAASRTASIRMILENGPERHCLEITRGQHPRELIDPGPGVPVLLDAQAIGQVNDSQTTRTT
ncbi:hypothetical protein CHU98_g5891 [Xylaria longipes]|nr:hypothetical protein CHU98_g5891 [Xylaria longipes]